MEAVLEKVTEENQKLKRDLNWAEVFVIGMIINSIEDKKLNKE